MLMSCSRLSIQHRCALRLPPRWQARKMMRSWLHHHRSITHNPRHLPAPSLRPAQRPLMASRLIARCSPGSFSLFTEFLHRLPSRRRHNCSPCTARRMKSSSTTHGPVISHACISSNRPQPLLWRHWSSGPITRPVSTATSHWIPWRRNSFRRVSACQKATHLRSGRWRLCGDWSPATSPSSLKRR